MTMAKTTMTTTMAMPASSLEMKTKKMQHQHQHQQLDQAGQSMITRRRRHRNRNHRRRRSCCTAVGPGPSSPAVVVVFSSFFFFFFVARGVLFLLLLMVTTVSSNDVHGTTTATTASSSSSSSGQRRTATTTSISYTESLDPTADNTSTNSSSSINNNNNNSNNIKSMDSIVDNGSLVDAILDATASAPGVGPGRGEAGSSSGAGGSSSTTTATAASPIPPPFANLNNLLKSLTIRLPDMNDLTATNGIRLDLSQIECNQIQIGDIDFMSTSTPTSSGTTIVALSVKQFDMVCSSRYNFDGPLGISSGSGDVLVYFDNNEATASATIVTTTTGSTSDESNIPISVDVNSCQPRVQISDIDFVNGGFFGWVLNTIEGLMRSSLEQAAARQLCAQLTSMLEEDSNQSFLQEIQQLLTVQYSSLTPEELDPLQSEQLVQLLLRQNGDPSIQLIDFGSSSSSNANEDLEEEDSSSSSWFGSSSSSSNSLSETLLQDVAAYLNEPVMTTGGTQQQQQEQQQQQLRINQLLQQNLPIDPLTGEMIIYDSSSSSSSSQEGNNINDNNNNLNFVNLDNKIWDNSDQLTSTTVWLNKVSVKGIDTIKYVNALDLVGNYTIRSGSSGDNDNDGGGIEWENLSIQLEMRVQIRPSTTNNNNSPIIDTGGQPNNVMIDDIVVVDFTLNDLQMKQSSLMVAIDQSLVENLQLGSLLRSTDNLQSCLMSTFYKLELSTLLVEVGDIVLGSSESDSSSSSTTTSPSIISGFLDDGLDRLMNQILETAFELYEPAVLKATPSYFQRTVREDINQFLNDKFLNDDDAKVCEPPMRCSTLGGTIVVDFQSNNLGMQETTEDPLVDFRDLLLEPGLAKERGGTGLEPYGTVFSQNIMPWVQSQFGTAQVLNDKLRSFSQSQSGTSGTFQFDDIFSWTYDSQNDQSNASLSTLLPVELSFASLFDTIRFSVQSVTINNLLDAVVGPIQLLDPTSRFEDGNGIFNKIGIDSTNSDVINVTARLSLDIAGPISSSSPLEMSNTLDLTVAVPAANFTLGLLANIPEDTLLKFPVAHVANVHCWMAALQEQFDDAGSDESAQEVMISTMAVSLSSMLLDAKCVDVSPTPSTPAFTNKNSPGCDMVSQVLDRIQQAGFSNLFLSNIETLMEDMLKHEWDEIMLQVKNEIPDRCPQYDSLMNGNDRIRQRTLHEHVGVDQIRRSLSGSLPSSADSSAIESVNTMVGMGLITFHSFVIVASENANLLAATSTTDVGDQAPTYFDKVNDLGDGIIDWSNILSETSGSTWITSAFERFRDFISDSTKMNEYIQNNFLDSDGVMTVDFGESSSVSFPALSFLGTDLSLKEIRISGLDTISNISPLRFPEDGFEIANSLDVDSLSVMVVIDVSERSSTGSFEESSTRIEIQHDFDNIKFDLDAAIAVNGTRLGEMELGSFIDIGLAASCLLEQAVEAIEITNLHLSIGEISAPTIRFVNHDKSSSGSPLQTLQQSTSTILDALYNEFVSEISTGLPLLVNTTIRESINAILSDTLESSSSTNTNCHLSQSDSTSPDEIVDLRDLFLNPTMALELGGSGLAPYGNLISEVYDMVQQQIGTPKAANNLLRDFVVGVSAPSQSLDERSSLIWLLDEPVVDFQSDIQVAGLTANVGLLVTDVQVTNLNSIGDPFGLLELTQDGPTLVQNDLTIGVPAGNTDRNSTSLTMPSSTVTVEKPLVFETRAVFWASDGAEMDIYNDISIEFSIQNVSIHIDFLVEILEQGLLAFPIKDMSNVDCWLSLLAVDKSTGFDILEGSLSTGTAALNVTCNNCTSTGLDELVSVLYDNPDDIANLAESQFVDMIVDGGILSGLVRDLVLKSRQHCPHRTEYDPTSVDSAGLFSNEAFSQLSQYYETGDVPFPAKSPLLNALNSIIAILLISCFISAKLYVKRQNLKWKKQLEDEGRMFLDRQLAKQRHMDVWFNKHTTSFFQASTTAGTETSPLVIDKRLHYLVPSIVVANIGLFIGAHFAVLTVTHLDVAVAEEDFTIHSFLVYRFWPAVLGLFDNGGTEMAVLIIIFTGIWPYIKLLMLFMVWVTPPKFLSVNRRGTLLVWIDALARLSIFDILLLLLAFATLLVFIGGPDQSDFRSAGGNAYYAFKAICVPHAGAYCFLSAERLSRVLSQLFLDCHEQVLKDGMKRLRYQVGDRQMSVTDTVATSVTDTTATTVSASTVASPGRSMFSRSILAGSTCELSPARNDVDINDNDGLDLPSIYLTPSPNQDVRRNRIPTESSLIVDGTEHNEPEDIPSIPQHHCSPPSTPQSMSQESSTINPSLSFDSSVFDQTTATASTSICTPASGEVHSNTCHHRQQEPESERKYGVLGLVLAIIGVVILFVTAVAFVPKISFDITILTDVAFNKDDDNDFGNAVSSYSVFLVFSSILLNAKFLIDSESYFQYIGLGICILLFVLSASMVTMIKTYSWMRAQQWCKNRCCCRRLRLCGCGRDGNSDSSSSSSADVEHCHPAGRQGHYSEGKDQQSDGITSYLRFYRWRHMEIYLISLVVGLWQLTAVSSYVIYTYCQVLDWLFDIVGYLGLTNDDGIDNDDSDSCYWTQLTLPGNLVIILGSVILLVTKCYFDVKKQYKTNSKVAMKFIERRDLRKLSSAWTVVPSPDTNDDDGATTKMKKSKRVKRMNRSTISSTSSSSVGRRNDSIMIESGGSSDSDSSDSTNS